MTTAPATTTVQWLSIVRKADKDFDEDDKRPVVYEFAKGRVFKERQPVYD